MVAVKYFPENTYFPKMLISGKGKYFSVFGCILKNFPENIFWCLEKKKENTNPSKIPSTIAISRSTAQACDGARSRSIWDRDRSEIAIDGAISRRREIAILIYFALCCCAWIGPLWFVDRRYEMWIGVDRSPEMWIGAWIVSFSLCCCAWIGARCVAVCAFVLCFASLFSLCCCAWEWPGNELKWKWERKFISGSKGKIMVNRNAISGKLYFPLQPNMRKRVKMISWNHFHPKQTQPQSQSTCVAKSEQEKKYLIQ